MCVRVCVCVCVCIHIVSVLRRARGGPSENRSRRTGARSEKGSRRTGARIFLSTKGEKKVFFWFWSRMCTQQRTQRQTGRTNVLPSGPRVIVRASGPVRLNPVRLCDVCVCALIFLSLKGVKNSFFWFWSRMCTQHARNTYRAHQRPAQWTPCLLCVPEPRASVHCVCVCTYVWGIKG